VGSRAEQSRAGRAGGERKTVADRRPGVWKQACGVPWASVANEWRPRSTGYRPTGPSASLSGSSGHRASRDGPDGVVGCVVDMQLLHSLLRMHVANLDMAIHGSSWQSKLAKWSALVCSLSPLPPPLPLYLSLSFTVSVRCSVTWVGGKEGNGGDSFLSDADLERRLVAKFGQDEIHQSITSFSVSRLGTVCLLACSPRRCLLKKDAHAQP
jgi:hypothetical protein